MTTKLVSCRKLFIYMNWGNMETTINIVNFMKEKNRQKKRCPCQMLHRALITMVVGMVYVDLHADVFGFIR